MTKIKQEIKNCMYLITIVTDKIEHNNYLCEIKT
jgi:hypothetical protein